MRFGIPKYRLPRDVLDAEVKRIEDLGVIINYNAKIANIAESMADGGFDAAFLAVGAHIAKRAYIPAGEAAKVLDAVAVLRTVLVPAGVTLYAPVPKPRSKASETPDQPPIDPHLPKPGDSDIGTGAEAGAADVVSPVADELQDP